jgi:branched-subunit amino acid aminotransferase/4-amino-4-deoxychorismate lyase
MSIIWHNGQWKDENEAIWNAHDRVRLGECVFGTVLCLDGRLIRGTLHMDKLFNHLKVIDFEIPYDKETLLETAQTLLQKNAFTAGHYAFNIFVTGGPGGNGIRPPEARHPQITMRALPCPSNFPPIHAIIAQNVRRNEGSPLSQIKCANYGENIIALKEAQQRGGNEAILLNNAGNITCASVASLFIVKDGRLYTPPLSAGVQSGVTRKTLIERYNAQEKNLTEEDLAKSDGIYLANSLRGVKPVVSLNGQTMPKPSLTIHKDFHLE